MAPIPPVLVRILAGFMTQALTRRLQQSPAFFRLVDRLVHEADHLPHRLQGKPVPPYVGRDPHEPTLGEQAEEAWRRQVDDPGEPHDLADPFRSSSSSQGAPQAPVKTHMDPLLQRQRARDSFEAAQQHAQRARQKQREREESVKRDKGMDEMRALLDKLREDNKNG